MKVRIAPENADAEGLLPPAQPDGSRIGVNYVDAYLKAMNVTLDDGRKVSCKRRGLQITVAVGEQKGEALMRRLEYGPDAKDILRQALEEAAEKAGAKWLVEEGVVYLDFA